MQSLSWDNYRYILAIYRCETLAGAARLLGVNETTVSRRLAQSEDALQLRLFTRRSGGWVATDSGRRLIARIERVKAELDEAQAEVANQKTRVAGLMRIACEPVLMNRMLAPHLPVLLEQHPELMCELVAVSESDVIRDADILVQVTPLSSTAGVKEDASSSRHLQIIGQLELGIFRARHTRESGVPWVLQVEDIHAHPFWAVDKRVNGTASDNGAGMNDASRVSVDSAETLLSCVRSGIGQCWLPLGVGMRDSTLVRIDSEQPSHFRELVQISQPELSGSARLAACSSWLKVCLNQFNHF